MSDLPKRPKPSSLDAKLQELAPSGYLFAHNLRGARPETVRTTYPSDWIREYNWKLYGAVDPVVQFTLLREGVARWSEITEFRVPVVSNLFMAKAEVYGLKFGVIHVHRSPHSNRKSALSLARADREFTDDEIEYSTSLFWSALPTKSRPTDLSPRQQNALCLARDGTTMKEIGDRLGVSMETVKKDMQSARHVLNAKNVTHAVSIAITSGQIPGTCDTFW